MAYMWPNTGICNKMIFIHSNVGDMLAMLWIFLIFFLWGYYWNCFWVHFYYITLCKIINQWKRNTWNTFWILKFEFSKYLVDFTCNKKYLCFEELNFREKAPKIHQNWLVDQMLLFFVCKPKIPNIDFLLILSKEKRCIIF